MDAQAYLIRHGWSGPGNPLNPNSKHHPHGGLGLTRPILVSRKNNNHGVGKKTTKDPTNQWWLRGFEDALKGVGTEQRDNGGGSSANALTSELYRFFVRGEVLEGTIRRECGHGQGVEGATGDDNDREKSGKGKRKRVDSDDDEVKEAKMRKKEKKREEKKKKKKKEKEEGVSSERCSSDEASKEDKEERRRRRKEGKRKRKAEDSKDGSKTKSSSKAEKKKKEKRRRKETLISAEADYPTPASTEQEQTDFSGQDESTAIGKTLKEKKDKKRKESKKSKKSKTDENADPGLGTSKESKKANQDKRDKKKKSTSD